MNLRQKAGLIKISAKELIRNNKSITQIIVSDNGPGILAKNIDLVFKRGFSTVGGTGLGLHIVQDIITNDHGGTVNILSGDNAGTSVIIEIPSKHI